MIQQKQLDYVTDFSCSQHIGQPINTILLDQSLLIEKRLLCSQCVENIDQNQKTIEIEKALEITEQKVRENSRNDLDFVQSQIINLHKLQSNACQMRSYINSQLESIIQISSDWIKELKTFNNQYQMEIMIKELDNLLNYQNKETERDSKLTITQLHQIAVLQSYQMSIYLEQFSSFQEYQECQQILEMMTNIDKIRLQHSIQESSKTKIQPFTFEIIAQNSIKQPEYCQAIAINQDNTLVLVGCEKEIRVFELIQNKLVQIDILKGHNDSIFTLDFFKKQKNSFISGSRDDSIMIWLYLNEQKKSWSCSQQLVGHTSSILCLIYNQKEDLIISGSDDKTIKFWSYNENCENNNKQLWSCFQTIKKHSSYVYALSLNENQTKLISCGLDKLILVMELLKTQYSYSWIVLQEINVENDGYRLCFIENNIFAFQPRSYSKMDIYEITSNSEGQFLKTKEIDVKGYSQSCDNLFPSKFSNQKCILMIKNGKNVNLIRCGNYCNGNIVSERQFVLEQVIEFDDNCIYGTLSDDGQYLLTWDYFTKEIQIRCFQSKE
ncbi:unnamed protein product [Paramecium primaurelia]|uniref:WD domain, G-beta repeat protein n=1 Tax=Paramecium primaurelia TaxID=5886 RepID=A0A8S1MXE9_PARPR|nr:unnamed protein product [Paramecium primaurelia]CAD8119866.1 unnamed protein product [Paramecium primaurelia]